MRFKGLDLNLLVTLDRLLVERNVSRAAEQLFLSQSATSGALARLREFFGDELLVQVGRQMTLTPRAEELAPAIRSVLMQIGTTIIEHPELDLARVHRMVRIVASDYACIAFLADAIRRIQAEAPGITFQLIAPNSEPTAMITRGQVDLAVMPTRFLTADHPSAALFDDDHSVLVCAGNSRVGETLDVDTFLSLPQVTVQLEDGPPNYETAAADLFGNRRHKEVVVANFVTVPFMLSGTDRAAIVHSRLASIFCRTMALRRFPVPVALPALRFGLQWHGAGEGDRVIAFVRESLLGRPRPAA